MTAPAAGLLDTSIFVAQEQGRAFDRSLLPETTAMSVITVGELTAGVLAATDGQTRADRLATLNRVSAIEVLDIDERVAASWARLRVHVASAGRRPGPNDLWIAATALVHRLPLFSQDDDFASLADVQGLSVVRV